VEEFSIDPSYYVQPDADGDFRNGAIFHIQRNAHGGSTSTPVGRYFTTRPWIGAEGYHPHSRVDCIVRDHQLAPDERWLAQRLTEELLSRSIIAEPFWLSWHRARELGGEAHGEVFDLD